MTRADFVALTAMAVYASGHFPAGVLTAADTAVELAREVADALEATADCPWLPGCGWSACHLDAPHSHAVRTMRRADA